MCRGGIVTLTRCGQRKSYRFSLRQQSSPASKHWTHRFEAACTRFFRINDVERRRCFRL